MFVQTPAYFTLAKTVKTATLLSEINTALDLLDNYLAYHTFLVNYEISASDWAIWGAIRG
jgi:glutamyl-tRNA synthetase